MTQSAPEHQSHHDSDSGRTDYERLLHEAQRPTEIPSLSGYQEIADQIRNSALYYRSRGVSAPSAREDLHEIYVAAQENEALKRFAIMAIDAPMMAAIQTWLDSHPSEDVSAEGRVQAREMVYRKCEYNHIVREVMLDARQTMDRPTFAALTDHATNGRTQRYLHSAVTGMSSEVALFDSLKEMPGMSEVTFTDVDTDFRGTDITAYYQGRPLAFDVKFDKPVQRVGQTKIDGQYMPHLTIGVPVEAIQDMGASEAGKRLIARRVHTMLAGANIGLRSVG